MMSFLVIKYCWTFGLIIWIIVLFVVQFWVGCFGLYMQTCFVRQCHTFMEGYLLFLSNISHDNFSIRFKKKLLLRSICIPTKYDSWWSWIIFFKMILFVYEKYHRYDADHGDKIWSCNPTVILRNSHHGR